MPNPLTELLKSLARPCEACARPILKILKYDYSGMVPLDSRPAVHVVFRDRDKPTELRTMTARQFCELVQNIRLSNGTEIPGDRLIGFFVNHFATCSEPQRFSAHHHPRK